MNKAELVEKIAGDAKISRSQAQKAIKSFISNTVTAVKGGKKVTLAGFGTFRAVKRAARKGRNPKTGASINIPARTVVKFKAGTGFAAKLR